MLPAGRFDDVEVAILSRHDACVTPSAMTTIYAELARHAGATFELGVPYRSLHREPGRWVLDLGDRSVSARRLVVAAGAWSKRLLAELGHPLPMAPYRTQAALLLPSPAPTEPFPTAHDLDTDVYLRPEANGRILGGDGTEKVEADPDRFVPGGTRRSSPTSQRASRTGSLAGPTARWSRPGPGSVPRRPTADP